MIVVFGSINADLVFEVPSLPRPGETVLAPDYRALPGGKGANQALAARRAGTEVALYGRVGRDAFADTALGLLKRDGVDLAGVAAGQRPTGCAAVCVDPAAENQIVVASGANRDARADDVPDDALGRGSTLVLQLELDLGETAALVARAGALGTRIVLNAAPAAQVPAEMLRAVDVLVVNGIEATTLAGVAQAPAPDPIAAARGFAGALGCLTIATLGRDGAIAFEAEAAWRVDALEVDARDTTGAGDAFVGVLAAALDTGRALPDALVRASVAAGLACTGPGAQQSMPDSAMIEARLGDIPAPRRA